MFPSVEKQAESIREEMGRELDGENREWINQFREYRNITELTRYIVVTLIDRILIYRDHRIEIAYRWQDEYQWQTELLAQTLCKSAETEVG